MSLATWTRDLALGARFAVTGGRPGLLRTLLTATGVGFGVALLLLAVSLPNMLFQREVREAVRAVDGSEQIDSPRADSFLHLGRTTTYRDDVVTGLLVTPEGDAPPVPPGTAELPAAGEMAVSPALSELLDSPEGALLKERIPYKVTGTIGPAGLIGPSELRYVARVDFLTTENFDGRGTRYGWSVPEEPMNAFLVLLVIVACVVLLLPVLVFIATAVRFGGEQRDRRLAALRLVGADIAMTRRIAAGESLAGALFGLLVGLGLFAVARQFAGAFTIWDVNAFPSDVVPLPALAVIVLASVPVASVVVTLFALRGVAIEPLGVVRVSTPRRRRLWWRLLLLAAGAALLVPLMGEVQVTETRIDSTGVVAGTTLALIGLTTLLPWLVEAFVKRLHSGPVAWQLAVRRLQLSSGTAARAVSGIVVAATGAIALQMLFQAMERDFTELTGQDTSRAQIAVGADARNADEARGMIDRIARTEGVAGVIGVIESRVWRPGPLKGSEEWAPTTSLRIGDCASLGQFATLPSCKDGDVFVFLAHGAQGNPDDAQVTGAARPGATVVLRDPHPHPSAPKPPKGTPLPQWRIPATARIVDSRPDPTGMYQYGVLATPSAIDAGLVDEPDAQALVRLDPAVPDAADHVRNTAAGIDPTSWVRDLKDIQRDAAFSSVRTGILVGSTLTMLLVAASLLVSTLEQLKDRKRLLSSLVAFGTRRSTLSWSVLWQTAVPIVLGLVLAVAGGLGLGVVLLKMGGQQVQDWWAFLPVVGIGLALIAAVTLLSMPVLWRLMRADGLRTE
ncbi:FtsX-like permease family protein [Streptomyces gardneri]|uniref:Membrane protein n=1 Tax=Streptomyces gardneri TaxID=66892 RepID=A0A4Y3RXA4_9ACTN|nr:FtsX-like permease family protein [Streptomyces gardneri]GEB61373.1 membrane protein [Streptomyces gardneri]GHG87013.1 membrane protein [Streptomyces gardneri]